MALADGFCRQCGAAVVEPAPSDSSADAAGGIVQRSSIAWAWVVLVGFVTAVIGLFPDWLVGATDGVGPLERGHFFRLDGLLRTQRHLDMIVIGLATICGAAATLAHLLGRLDPRTAHLLAGGCAALLLAIALLQFELLARLDADLTGVYSAGAGLWVFTSGAALAIASVAVAWFGERSP